MSIENPYVAKYGKFLHLERALQGAWRVTPATEYKRTDLTAAQQDDELKKSSLMSPTTTIGVPVPTGGFVRVAPIGRVTRTTEIRRAFYMSSLTKCGDDSASRFISEFNADARLAIHDPRTFGQRVCAAAEKLRPNWTAFFAPCHYFNPDAGHPDYLESDSPDTRDSLPWRLKQDSYAWQQEWRFIWLPNGEVTELRPIELMVGSIADIAVLERLTEPT
jgi:hypothetical protein